MKKDKPWTTKELERLRTAYPAKTAAELREMFGRSEEAIAIRARRLGLRKNLKDKPRKKQRDWVAVAEAHVPAIYFSVPIRAAYLPKLKLVAAATDASVEALVNQAVSDALESA